MKMILKPILGLFVMCCLLVNYGCNSKTAKAETLTTFLEGVVDTQGTQINLNEPIISIKTIAQQQAVKTIQLSKANITAALNEAREYKYALIIVGKHTLLKITDFDDCQKSTSWGANMPYAEGYIQKDGLTKKSDYLNQLIGKPGSQACVMYLFR